MLGIPYSAKCIAIGCSAQGHDPGASHGGQPRAAGVEGHNSSIMEELGDKLEELGGIQEEWGDVMEGWQKGS